MRLGVAYNAFDSLELLGPSIDHIRQLASYICVVYQTKSNFGEQAPIENVEYLEGIKDKVDHIEYYNPSGLGGHANEVAKRNIGLDYCRRAECTHFMSMDCDEFYKTEELERAMSVIESGHFESSGCQMQTYYKTGEYALDPPESYYVPLIYKVDQRLFSLSNKWPVVVDPTRRLNAGSIRIFRREEIEMHHLSYVRKDMRLKLRNSSAGVNFKSRVEEISSYYDSWQPGMKALLAGREERWYDVRTVDDVFKINLL